METGKARKIYGIKMDFGYVRLFHSKKKVAEYLKLHNMEHHEIVVCPEPTAREQLDNPVY